MSRALSLIPQAATWAHRLDPRPIQSMAQLQRCPQVPSSLGHEGLDISPSQDGTGQMPGVATYTCALLLHKPGGQDRQGPAHS